MANKHDQSSIICSGKFLLHPLLTSCLFPTRCITFQHLKMNFLVFVFLETVDEMICQPWLTSQMLWDRQCLGYLFKAPPSCKGGKWYPAYFRIRMQTWIYPLPLHDQLICFWGFSNFVHWLSMFLSNRQLPFENCRNNCIFPELWSMQLLKKMIPSALSQSHPVLWHGDCPRPRKGLKVQ